MIRRLPILLLSLTALSQVVAAEERLLEGHAGTLHQQQACRSDVLRYCADVQAKGDYTMADCLKANADKLNPACRQALEHASR
jgi:hypothetical protein